MNFKTLTDQYSVGGQITTEDATALAKAGFRAVICNRPDSEVDAHQTSARIEQAVRAQGMAFFFNPVSHQGLTMENLTAHQNALDAAQGPVFAYCRSGQRSAVCWSFAQAGRLEVDEILNATARAGFRLDGMRDQIEALANSSVR